MTEQELYDMKLHDTEFIGGGVTLIMIIRVIGGWLYERQNGLAVFVPEPEKAQYIIYPDGYPIPYYPPQYPYVPQQPMYWNSPSTTGSGQ